MYIHGGALGTCKVTHPAPPPRGRQGSPSHGGAPMSGGATYGVSCSSKLQRREA